MLLLEEKGDLVIEFGLEALGHFLADLGADGAVVAYVKMLEAIVEGIDKEFVLAMFGLEALDEFDGCQFGLF